MIIDAVALNTLHAIGGNSFVVEMIDTFLAFYPKIMGEARSGLQEGNMEPVIRMGHTLQSSGRNVGAIGLTPLADQIEAAAKRKLIAVLPALLDELDRTYACVRTALEEEKQKRLASPYE